LKISLLNKNQSHNKEISITEIDNKNWLDFVIKLKEEIIFNNPNPKENFNNNSFKEENDIKDWIEEIKILIQYNYIQSSTSNETLIKSDEDLSNNLLNLDIEDLSRRQYHNRNSRNFNYSKYKNNIIDNDNDNDIENKEFNLDKKIWEINIENLDKENDNIELNKFNIDLERRRTNESINSQSDIGNRGNWVFERISDVDDVIKENQYMHFNSFKLRKSNRNSITIDNEINNDSNFDNYFNEDKNSTSSENSQKSKKII